MRLMTKRGKVFYRFLWRVMLIVFIVAQSIPASAVKVHDVANTKHNLSTSKPAAATFYSTDESQICVFCHTPHNASPSVPLWNNLSTTQNFTMYSSATIEYSPTAYAGGLPPGSISRLCLSCHEGTVGMNSLVNPGSTGANPTMWGFDRFVMLGIDTKGKGGFIGDDLTNMHPVGIDYEAVQSADDDIYATPTNAELKLFPGSGLEMYLECPTCHDPHVDSSVDLDYEPFLRIPNTSSNMCLSCHDK